MRRTLTFACAGEELAATLDGANCTSGLLIVSGGNEIRVGAHRGMAKLARDVAREGFPVFRFDRRGIGDSAGENGGFTSSAPDIETAITAFRAECPQLARIIAFGNCDAASALALHQPQFIAHFVLANPWVFEAEAGAPAPAAVKAHYLKRLSDPVAWRRLLTGGVKLGSLLKGLARAAAPAAPSSLADAVGAGLAALPSPVTILLAEGDNTAIAFRDQWGRASMAEARARHDVSLSMVATGSHSFAEDAAYNALKSAILTALSKPA